ASDQQRDHARVRRHRRADFFQEPAVQGGKRVCHVESSEPAGQITESAAPRTSVPNSGGAARHTRAAILLRFISVNFILPARACTSTEVLRCMTTSESKGRGP